MKQIDENVLVSTNHTGEPVGFLWRNSTYRVRTKPVRWFARRDWWIEASRVQRGIGPGVLEVEMWRMVATKDSGADVEPKVQFDIVHTHDSANQEKHIWRLVKVYD